MNLKILLVLITFFNLNLYAKEKKLNPAKPVEIKASEEKATETDSVKAIPVPATETIKKEASLATETLKVPPPLVPETDSGEKKPFYDEPQNTPLTEDEIISMLKEKHKGSIVGKFINSYPRLIKLTVRVITDKEITKIWANTLKDKTRYYVFAAILFLTMAINWAWRRNQSNTIAPFFDKVKSWFLRIFLINFSRFALFVLLFEFELRPIWVLVRKTFEF